MALVWISLIVAASIFIVGEFFIPVHPEAPNRKIQKHFWATTLSIIGLVLALLFSFITETDRKLEKIGLDVERLSGPVNAMAAQGQNGPIWDIFVGTEKILRDEDATGMLSTWVNDTVRHLREDVSRGFIPIDDDQLKIDLPRLLDDSKEFAMSVGALPSIVATNVGSTNVYFEPWYLNAHTRASSRGVPIIRFFLYDADKKIQLRGSDTRAPVAFEDYTKEVREIHDKAQTLFSAVVVVSSCPQIADPPKDYLLLNDDLLLESEVGTDWDIGHVTATGSVENINLAHEFFEQLLNCLAEGNEADQFMMDRPKVE